MRLSPNLCLFYHRWMDVESLEQPALLGRTGSASLGLHVLPLLSVVDFPPGLGEGDRSGAKMGGGKPAYQNRMCFVTVSLDLSACPRQCGPFLTPCHPSSSMRMSWSVPGTVEPTLWLTVFTAGYLGWLFNVTAESRGPKNGSQAC